MTFLFGGTGALHCSPFIFEAAFDEYRVCTGKYFRSIHPLGALFARTVRLPR
jgi:hypothetical protein